MEARELYHREIPSVAGNITIDEVSEVQPKTAPELQNHPEFKYVKIKLPAQNDYLKDKYIIHASEDDPDSIYCMKVSNWRSCIASGGQPWDVGTGVRLNQPTEMHRGVFLFNLLRDLKIAADIQDRILPDGTSESCKKAWARFIGVFNVALSAPSSKEAHFLEAAVAQRTLDSFLEFIHLRGCGAGDYQKTKDLIKLFLAMPTPKEPSRKTMREIMIRVAEADLKLAMKSYQKKKYISIAIDAGTVGHRHFLEFVIHQGDSSLKELPICTMNFTGSGSKDDYCDMIITFFKEKLNGLSGHGIVASITSDMLPAQVAACSPLKEAPFMKNQVFLDLIKSGAIAEELEKIWHIPCGCHASNNSFKATANGKHKNQWFSQQVRDIKKLADDLEAAGFSNPTTVDTRWLYIGEILAWVYHDDSRITEIQRCLGCQLPISFYDVWHIVQPLLETVRLLSTSQLSLIHGYPIYNDVIRRLHSLRLSDELHSPDAKEACAHLEIEFYTRTIGSEYRPLYVTAFHVSPRGRIPYLDIPEDTYQQILALSPKTQTIPTVVPAVPEEGAVVYPIGRNLRRTTDNQPTLFDVGVRIVNPDSVDAPAPAPAVPPNGSTHAEPGRSLTDAASDAAPQAPGRDQDSTHQLPPQPNAQPKERPKGAGSKKIRQQKLNQLLLGRRSPQPTAPASGNGQQTHHALQPGGGQQTDHLEEQEVGPPIRHIHGDLPDDDVERELIDQSLEDVLAGQDTSRILQKKGKQSQKKTSETLDSVCTQECFLRCLANELFTLCVSFVLISTARCVAHSKMHGIPSFIFVTSSIHPEGSS